MYTFSNDKVKLRAVSMSDVADQWRWRNDPDVTRYAMFSAPRSYEVEENIVRNQLAGSDNEYRFAIDAVDGAEPVHIGICGLHFLSWRNRNAMLGISIGEKEYWSKGYGSAALELLMEFGFGELNLHRIYLYVFSFNPRAVRSYEKCGFKHEATLRDDTYREGRFYDSYLMAILKPEWEERYVHLPE